MQKNISAKLSAVWAHAIESFRHPCPRPNKIYNICLKGRQIINLLKPTGHVMHQQFNIQQLYLLPTLYLCALYLFENKQRLVPLTA